MISNRVEDAFVRIEEIQDEIDGSNVMVSEKTDETINLGLLEDFAGRSTDEGNLLFQSGNSVRCKSVEFDQHGLNGSIVCVCEGCTEVVSDMFRESFCLRDAGELFHSQQRDHSRQIKEGKGKGVMRPLP